MLLRTRIILIVSAALLLTSGGLVLAGLQRERLIPEPLAVVALRGTEALWAEVAGADLARLRELGELMAEDPQLAAALARGDPAALRATAGRWVADRIASRELSDMQIVDDDGRLLFAASAGAEPGSILDVSALRSVRGGTALEGLRQTSIDRFRFVSARPLPMSNGTVALVLAAPVDRALSRFGDALGAGAFLLNMRGRLIEASGDPSVWSRLEVAPPSHVASVSQASADGRRYSIAVVPVADIATGSAGLIATVRDATDSLGAVARITSWTAAGTAVLVVTALVGLFAYLRTSFRPLDRAVAVLGALSRGDTAADLEKEGDDEIGRIAEAIAALRTALISVGDSRRQRDLQRRRQERFVRRQMERLADTLEPGARDEVLADLRRIVAGGDGAQSELSDLIRNDEQLGPLAAVLQQMSRRVVEQHRRLSELVARLQEALVRETQLASLQQELQIARELQLSVIPRDFPDRRDFELHGIMEPAREVGGDFYDFFERADGLLVLVIADVSGKGVPAAFFMAIARTLLKAIALFEPDPAVCLRQLNQLLCAGNDQAMFVTVFLAVYDPASGRLDYVSAGHNPPFRVGRAGDVAFLEMDDDMAVAVMEDQSYTTRHVVLSPGDALVLYTDGVTEAFSPEAEAFGDARLAEVLGTAVRRRASEMAMAVLDAVRAHEAGSEQSDDITMLVLARKSIAE